MPTMEIPRNLLQFQRLFPDDGACAKYLEAVRWPDGFTCPRCNTRGEPYRFGTRTSVVLRCRICRDKGNTSLTAGTVMQSSHTPLSTWFWSAYLMTTHTPGMSAVQLQRQLGIKRIETAFQILHKLRAGMVRPERDTIGGEFPVEVDECYVGGKTRGEGKGVHHQATVVGAVEVRPRKDAEERAEKWRRTHGDKRIPRKQLVYAGRLRLRLVSDLPSVAEMLADPGNGRAADILQGFVRDSVTPGSTVRTDGWIGYKGLTGYTHDARVLGGDPDKAEAHLPMIHLVFSNLKTWLDGTHHGVDPKHLQAYLNEFVFRFNRRFYPMTSFHSLLGIAARTVPPTYAQLYSGEWSHAA